MLPSLISDYPLVEISLNVFSCSEYNHSLIKALVVLVVLVMLVMPCLLKSRFWCCIYLRDILASSYNLGIEEAFS